MPNSLIAIEDVYGIKLGHGFALRANRKRVKNLPTTGEHFFWNVWKEKG